MKDVVVLDKIVMAGGSSRSRQQKQHTKQKNKQILASLLLQCTSLPYPCFIAMLDSRVCLPSI